MFCKKCGKELKEGQKFCPQCGMPFNVSDETTKDVKGDFSPQNAVSNDSNSNIGKGNVDSQHSESKEVNQIHDASQGSFQSKVIDETAINAPENTPLNEDEVKKYGNLKKGLKWGGLVMAFFLGGGSLSDFSWFSFILYAALCYLVYNAFFGKEEGKTLADFNLLKLKTFACLGLCLTLFMCGPKGGSQSSLEREVVEELQHELDQENANEYTINGRVKTKVKSLKLKKVSDTDYTGDAYVYVTIDGKSFDSYIKVDVYDYHHYDDGRFTFHYNFNRHDYIHLLNNHGIY